MILKYRVVINSIIKIFYSRLFLFAHFDCFAMASRYNTRSASAATPTQNRRFCIVLTNNPQMIQTARRMVHDLPRNVSVSIISH